MEILKFANLALRFFLELCALTAMGYWGFHTGKGHFMAIVQGLGAPLLAAAVWGLFVSPKASIPVNGFVRLLIELSIFGSAVMALYAVELTSLAVIFGLVLLVNITLIYIWKQ